jgi:hypothetical protein
MFAEALDADPVDSGDDDRSLEQKPAGLEGDVEDADGDEVEIEAAADEATDEIEAKPEGDEEDDQPRDESGKFVKKDTKEGEQEQAEQPAKREPSVPPARLRETAERARASEERAAAAEARLAEERQERAALKAQMDLLAQQIALSRQQPQQQSTDQAKTDPEPDIFADPEGWKAWNRRENAREIAATRDDYTKRLINMNLASTREAHGEKFDAAYQGIITAAQQEPEARLAIQRIWNSANPGAELMRWHRERETLRLVGGDPEAYNKKIEADIRAKLLADPEFRKEIVAGIRAEAGGANGHGAPRHVTRLPGKPIPSLNSSSGSAHSGERDFDDGSDRSLFEGAFK